jgi:ArsR family transcriptional regulator
MSWPLFQLQADTLKALAHPRRLEIVQLLRNEELCVGAILAMLDLPQANVSQHLLILKRAGVVVMRKAGKQIFYSLAHRSIININDELRSMLMEQHTDRPELSVPINDLLPLTHDPVCHMQISPKLTNFSAEYRGQLYHFCASGCHKQFTNHPEQYV